jgi:transposase InsO family protein
MPYEHWHTDISYVKIEQRFYFFICVLDGYSRFIVQLGDHIENMKENDVDIVQQVALEKIPGIRPRYITDNGKQFTGKEFQYFIALHGLTHVRTSPHYPQNNWKVERLHGTTKKVCNRKKDLLDQDHAKIIIGSYTPSTTINGCIVPMLTSLPLINSLAEITKYMKKGGKRFMRPD